MFYEKLATVYEHVFPAKAKSDFIQLQIAHNSKILDVGCADGRMAMHLSDDGHEVFGFDLSQSMVEIATKVSQDGKRFKVRQGNMLATSNVYPGELFDVVLCTGNTLVHLASEAEISKVISEFSEVLRPGGKLIVQILNYDAVYRQAISELPLIDNEFVTFKRNYEFADRSVSFITELTIKSSAETIKARTELFPIGKEQLEALILAEHLSITKVYSGYDEKPFDPQKLPLIIVAEKV